MRGHQAYSWNAARLLAAWSRHEAARRRAARRIRWPSRASGVASHNVVGAAVRCDWSRPTTQQQRGYLEDGIGSGRSELALS
jgi:hypothetical protein